MTFVQREITVSFSMGSGNFQGGGNTGTFSGLRVSARIDCPAGEVGQSASIAIWGMPLSAMNQLSIIGRSFGQVLNNTVTLTAGDAIAGLQLTFIGTVLSAYIDGNSQPQVCFRVEAKPSAQADAKNSPPTSVKGNADVTQIFQQLASKAGLQFENNGVSKKLRNPYLPGSIGNQIRDLARQAGIEHLIDKGKLAIWNPEQGRAGSVTLSPQTGLVGYPAFNATTLIVKSIFNPKIENGTTITVQSDVQPACGQWNVFHVAHEIESQMPNGKWFTIIQANNTGGDINAP